MGRRTVRMAVRALETLSNHCEDGTFAGDFETLVDMVFRCKGRVVVTGLGKSGVVARKIAATFIATGTQATYFHPGDSGPGDVGVVEPDDVVIVVSRTGSVPELAPILSYCRRFRVSLAMITTNARATGARFADLWLNLPRVPEAVPSKLTPTTATTVQLVFGDALAMAVMARRGFSQDDFYKFHPSGRLGAQLLKVAEVMATGKRVPRVSPEASLIEATVEMSRARYGGTAVVDEHGALIGAFTDGDLRRSFASGGTMNDPVGKWMTLQPSTIGARDFASEALARMQGQSIMLLFVVEGARLIGVLHMHDVLAAGTA